MSLEYHTVAKEMLCRCKNVMARLPIIESIELSLSQELFSLHGW